MTSVWFDILVAYNDSIFQYDMISVMITYQCDITNKQVMISIIIWYDISMIFFCTTTLSYDKELGLYYVWMMWYLYDMPAWELQVWYDITIPFVWYQYDMISAWY